MGILDSGISLDGVDESATGDYSPVPDGQYTIEAVKFESRTYGSGNEGVDVQFSIKPGTNGYPDKNAVKSFLSGNTQAPAPQAQAAAPQMQAPQAQAQAPQGNQPVNWAN